MARPFGSKDSYKRTRSFSQFCPVGHDKLEDDKAVGTHDTYCRKCHAIDKPDTVKFWKKWNIRKQDGTLFNKMDYDRQYQIQQGCCAICKRHQSEVGRSLNVDHDHVTNLFRALLCGTCNTHLGIYEKMKSKAENYLKGSI